MRSLWLDTHDAGRVPTHELPPGVTFDVAVVGAGLTGLATAVQLARTGRRVAVLEARTMGAVATGNTTAKLSLLQGTRLSAMRQRHSADAVRAYVDGSRSAQQWLLDLCEARGVEVQRRPAYTFATDDPGAENVRAELDAGREAGIEVLGPGSTELPLETTAAIVLGNQAQFHPMQVLTALAEELDTLGGILVEGVRVTGAGRRGPLTVSTTTRGEVHAERLVLATGIPMLDRGGHFSRVEPRRSYAIAYRVPESGRIPRGMYLSADDTHRSLRSVPIDGEERLIVGGGDHVTGREDSTASRVTDIDAWTHQHFPGAVRTHAWAAQDYHPIGELPLIEAMPGSEGTVLTGTGFAKWGMTGGVLAALGITGMIEDSTPEWFERLQQANAGLSGLAAAAGLGAGVAAQTVSGWAGAELHQLPQEPPAEGEGVVGRRHGRPAATSTVGGRTCRVSAVCTHLGGVLNWNDAEQTWDCPLHGSRFAADGALLEGPAARDLEQFDE